MSQRPKKAGLKPRHKLLMLIASIFIIPAIVTIIWYWLADNLQTTVQDQISKFSASGRTITCNNLDTRGFPFRMGIHCSHTAFDDNRTRTGITAGALRTAAQIYRPGHIVAELDGPFQLTSKSLQVDANWQNLQSSAMFELNGLGRGSIKATNLNAKIIEPQDLQIGSILADNFEMHTRQNEEDLDFAISANNLSLIDASGKPLETDIQFDLVSKALGLSELLEFGGKRDALNLRGKTVELQRLNVTMDDQGQLTLSGPMSFSADGLLTGVFDIDVQNPGVVLNKVFAHMEGGQIDPNLIKPTLSALSTGDSANNLKLKLNIKDGVAFIGPFPIGTIPPI